MKGLGFPLEGGHGVAEVRLGGRGLAGRGLPATVRDLAFSGGTQQGGHGGEGGRVFNMFG